MTKKKVKAEVTTDQTQNDDLSVALADGKASKTPLKTHGGKSYLAKWIVPILEAQPHTHFVEPYAGGLSVMLAKSHENISEVANDLDGFLTNFWIVLQREDSFWEFQRRCEATPFDQGTWLQCSEQLHDIRHYLPKGSSIAAPDPYLAWCYFVCCRQSMSGRMKSFSPIAKRVRRGMNDNASAWLSTVEGLAEMHYRLKRIVMLNDLAINVIKKHDAYTTLFYLDPPYLQETRSAKQVYEYEMDKEDHGELLNLINTCDAKIVISGYRSDLYDDRLRYWNRHEFDIANHSSSSKTKKRMAECLWCNF